jgi:hypothetical protein
VTSGPSLEAKAKIKKVNSKEPMLWMVGCFLHNLNRRGKRKMLTEEYKPNLTSKGSKSKNKTKMK